MNFETIKLYAIGRRSAYAMPINGDACQRPVRMMQELQMAANKFGVPIHFNFESETREFFIINPR